MASVWIARQTGKHGFEKLVAIKTILPKFAADPRFQQMFLDEARIASRIEHANVAQILDVGEQHEVTYLVMEYVDGDALSKLHRAARKKGGQIPLGVVLRVHGGRRAAGCTPPTSCADDDGTLLGVVHRDVSPQNILVSTQAAWPSSSTSASPRRATGSRATRTRRSAQGQGAVHGARAGARPRGRPPRGRVGGRAPCSITCSQRQAALRGGERRRRRSSLLSNGRPPAAAARRRPRRRGLRRAQCARALARRALRDGGPDPAGDRGGDGPGRAGDDGRGRGRLSRGADRGPRREAEGGDSRSGSRRPKSARSSPRSCGRIPTTSRAARSRTPE